MGISILIVCFSVLLVYVRRSDAYCAYVRDEIFSDIPDHELEALKDLYEATNGTGWSYCNSDYYNCAHWHFDGPVNPCSEKWEGITCRNISGQTYVYQLQMSNMNLFGTLPPSIGNFTELCALVVEGNRLLSGTIPIELGNLLKLQELELTSNVLHGQIPNSLGKLTQLETLMLDSNKLTGGIPSELGNLKDLTTLYLFYNTLNGTIPPEIGRLSNLRSLELYSNDLHGSIPPEICWLQRLTMLMIGGNQYTGSIPENIGNMTSLTEITLDTCGLNGSIPASISQLIHLNYLYLESNHLTGTIPADIGRMNQTYVLHLDNNHLRGRLPESMGEMTVLNDFQANHNELTGPLPASLIKTNLETLDLSYNHLSQQLPNIFSLHGLYRLVLSSNDFTGPLPPDYTKVLSVFEVDGNLLSKHLPSNLFTCWRLNYIYLFDNQFTGPIPVEINMLNYITDLEMDGNQLSGRLPGLLSNMSRLATWDIDSNDLTGEIPKDIGHLPVMLNLLMYGNHFTGTVPPEMGQLKGLTIMSLNDNLLSGTLSPALSRLNSLTIFFVYRNVLSGVLTDVFDSTTQKSLLYIDVSNNQFTGNLPLEVFRIGKLFSFAGVGNCFTGSIPADVCGATNLSTLALDGLMSATDCQMRFFPKWTSSYGLPNSIKGGFPSCIFGMPNLRNLHLSGNGLTGTIPSDVVISKSLADLSLSHNNIKGAIPPQMQRHNFTNLDLSYNKFRGTLDSRVYASYGRNGTLSVQVNRISGKIPSVLRHADSVTILDGNLYECNAARSDLPEHDSYSHIYECGSNTFNYTLYFWLAVIFTVGCVVVAGFLLMDCSAWVKLCREWMSIFEVTNLQIENIVSFGEFVAVLRKVTVVLTLIIVFVCMPAFLVLSAYYNTYNFEYGWVATGCYLSGVVPTAIILLLFALFGVGMVYGMYFIHQKTDISPLMDEPKTSEDAVKWKWSQYAQVSILVLFNLLLVTTVNILYVYVDHNYSSGIVRVTQLTVAMFKIVWKNLIVRLLLGVAADDIKTRAGPQKSVDMEVEGDSIVARPSTINETASKGHNLSLAVFVTIFNNIAAPFIATCYVSTNCFYNVIQSPPRVVVSYEYAMCAYGQFNGNYTACNAFSGVEVHSTTYDPPYIYSFQCSSTFITTYSSIYVFMFTMEAFFIPLVMGCLAAYHQKYGGPRPGKHKLLLLVESMIPKILQTVRGLPAVELTAPTDSLVSQIESNRATDQSLNLFANSDPYVPYFECAVYIVKLLNMFSILSTFGVILPPLAVVCCVSLLSATWSMQLFIGRFIVNVRQISGAAGLVRLVEEDANHAAWMFLDSIWMLAPFCVIFYALFLFDVIGDAVGWHRALWAPLLIFCGSIVAWMVYRWKKRKWVRWWQACVKYSEGGWERRVTDDGVKVQYSTLKTEYAPLSSNDEGMLKVLAINES